MIVNFNFDYTEEVYEYVFFTIVFLFGSFMGFGMLKFYLYSKRAGKLVLIFRQTL